MATFTYFEPSGDKIDNPTVDQIIAFMRQNGDYWGPYSPVGQLYRDDPGRVTLFFVRHPRRGWYIEHDDRDGTKPHLVAFDLAGNRNGWVEAWAEGESSYFLEACFLPQQVAERVVSEFFTSSVPSSVVSWEPVHWEIHRREGPPDDESLIVEVAENPE